MFKKKLYVLIRTTVTMKLHNKNYFYCKMAMTTETWKSSAVASGVSCSSNCQFLVLTSFCENLYLTQPPVQYVPGALTPLVKRSVRETDHLPPSNAEVKKCVDLYRHSPNTSSWRDVSLSNAYDVMKWYLVKHREI
jgi:hypothetical protein